METALADSTTTTPAPETSSAPESTPVTSTAETTVSTPVAAERPTDVKSLAAYLAKLDTPPAAAPPAPTTSATPGGPTAQAAGDPTKAGELASKPYSEPPKEAWPTILENARTKALAHYGITPQVTPETFRKGIDFARQIDANPIQFMEQLAANIAAHPVWGPQLRSSAGRTLATAAPPTRPAPDIEVRNEQGQVVGRTYSDAKWEEVRQWDRTQLKSEVTQMIQPFAQEREQRLQQEQIARAQQEVNAVADQSFKRIDRILDGRQDLHAHVAQLMATDPSIDPYDAALEVRAKFIVPKLEEQAKAAVLDTQLKKAQGNTANGNGAAPAQKRPQTEKELAAYLRSLDGA